MMINKSGEHEMKFFIKLLTVIEIVGLTLSAFAIVIFVDGVKGLASIPVLLFTLPYWWLLFRKDNK